MSLSIKIKPLPGRPLLPLPRYQSEEAAGMDLHAAESLTLDPGAWAAVGTGLSIEIPPGFEAQVRPRSGLAFKHGVTVLNAPGTIDSDYRGEVKVLLINHGKNPYEVKVEDRIAQLVIAKVEQAMVELVTSLAQTERGEGGFGHTGK
ncbi:MAG: dUTP diphosphatase [Myxococcota bacterium]|nr:dUTP diphosphatase [Myxococcota bacterium]